jgi:hypothetical protein
LGGDVTHAELHEMLARDPEGYLVPPEMGEAEQWLLRHLTIASGLLLHHAMLYRELLSLWEEDGPSDELSAAALEAAANLAVVLRSARRRPEVLAASSDTPLSSTLPLGALDQLFYSFTLLTAPPADEYADAKLSLEELDELLDHPTLRDWLDRAGAWDVFPEAEPKWDFGGRG